MKKCSILALILSLVLLCACIPTPDEEAVVNRADGALEKAVRGKPVDPYTYEAPSRLDSTELIREQEVRFESDVELPDAQQYPVTTIKQRAFAADDIAALLQAVRHLPIGRLLPFRLLQAGRQLREPGHAPVGGQQQSHWPCLPLLTCQQACEGRRDSLFLTLIHRLPHSLAAFLRH